MFTELNEKELQQIDAGGLFEWYAELCNELENKVMSAFYF